MAEAWQAPRPLPVASRFTELSEGSCQISRKGCCRLSYQLVQAGPSPKVQVLPANQIDPDPASLEEGDKDKFKCLYLLVETAVAVRQREKEQEPACWVFFIFVSTLFLVLFN